MASALISLACILIYWAVSMLMPAGRPASKPSKEPHTPQHVREQTYEEQVFEMIREAWLKGEEQWIVYALVVTDIPTVSWL